MAGGERGVGRLDWCFVRRIVRDIVGTAPVPVDGKRADRRRRVLVDDKTVSLDAGLPPQYFCAADPVEHGEAGPLSRPDHPAPFPENPFGGTGRAFAFGRHLAGATPAGRCGGPPRAEDLYGFGGSNAGGLQCRRGAGQRRGSVF